MGARTTLIKGHNSRTRGPTRRATVGSTRLLKIEACQVKVNCRCGDFWPHYPQNVVVDLEVPSRTLRNKGVSALERALMVVAATRKLMGAADC